jgi:hypothetical protein
MEAIVFGMLLALFVGGWQDSQDVVLELIHSDDESSRGRAMGMFRLDYLSCFLTIVATILVGRKMWTGLLVSGINSLIVCVIGVHTSQFGFIPANLFCICIYALNIRSWLKAPKDTIQSENNLDGELSTDTTGMNLVQSNAHPA